MADSKFRKQLDRQAVLHDFKNRLIDLMENGQSLPDTGIYDEPVRYFKANLKWTPIIFGWLGWLEDVAGWQDAEDENHAGIQAILTFEEGIEDMATTEEICAAIECGFVKLASRIVSGSTGGFVVDEDGNVTIGTGAAAEGLPEDDPETPLDENASSRAGGAIAVRTGINNLLGELNTYYGVDSVADTPLADVQFFIRSRYLCDTALMDAAIAQYWANRAASVARIVSLTTATLDAALYCKGVSKATINNVIIGTAGAPVEAKIETVDLVAALLDEQLDAWFAAGVLVPSTAYIAYSCTKVDIEEFTLDMSASNFPQYTTNAIYKASHRTLFEVSGSFVDSDVANTIQDFFYTVNTSTGVKTFLGSQFLIQGGNLTEPSQAQVPYEPSHIYAVTIDNPSAGSGGGGVMTVGRDNDTFTIPNVTGILTFKITDLGEYTV